MLGPRVLSGCLPPLFERLLDLSPASATDRSDALRLRGDDIRLSVGRSVARLLDTRRHVTLADAAEATNLTVIDYGIPDFGPASPADPGARWLMSEAIRRAIVAFEPRLLHPAVDLVTIPEQPSILLARIDGHIDTGVTVEPIVFRRALNADFSDTAYDDRT
jgi:type VI secretion system protein ImpF